MQENPISSRMTTVIAYIGQELSYLQNDDISDNAIAEFLIKNLQNSQQSNSLIFDDNYAELQKTFDFPEKLFPGQYFSESDKKLLHYAAHWACVKWLNENSSATENVELTTINNNLEAEQKKLSEDPNNKTMIEHALNQMKEELQYEENILGHQFIEDVKNIKSDAIKGVTLSAIGFFGLHCGLFSQEESPKLRMCFAFVATAGMVKLGQAGITACSVKIYQLLQKCGLFPQEESTPPYIPNPPAPAHPHLQ